LEAEKRTRSLFRIAEQISHRERLERTLTRRMSAIQSSADHSWSEPVTEPSSEPPATFRLGEEEGEGSEVESSMSISSTDGVDMIGVESTVRI
jgi:hypothetical protein